MERHMPFISKMTVKSDQLPAEVLSRNGLVKALGISHRHGVVIRAWTAMEAAIARGDAAGEILVAGKSVSWSLMRAQYGAVPVVTSTALGAFREALAGPPPAGPDDLSRNGLTTAIGVHGQQAAIKSAWSVMEAAIDRGETAGEIVVTGKVLPWRLMRTSKGATVPFVPASALDTFREAVNAVPRAGPGDLSQTRLVKALGLNHRHLAVHKPWLAMWAATDSGETAGEVVVAGKKVQWRLMRPKWGGSARGRGAAPHVPASCLEAFREALGAPLSGPYDLSRNAVAQALGVSHSNPVLDSTWSAMKAAVKGGKTTGVVVVAGKTVPWRLMRERGGPVPCVPASALKAFRLELKAAKA